jgi:hypothetical protein
MTPAADNKLGRRDFLILGAIWATVATLFIALNWSSIIALRMPDADDYLRLQQVRDWLAGQGWFDIAQHRVNPPTGGALHWSRIVDIPIALGILALKPLLGQATAEMVVGTALPMLTLGIAMLVAGAIAARMVGRAWAPAAALCVPFSAITYPQIMPLRVDHHGWQIVLALTLLWALTDETAKRRSGMIAGLAAAAWLNISIEGLPIVTVAALLLGARWLFDGGELPRLQAYLWALTLGSFALETITMPNAWTVVECDRVSQPYLAAFGIASLAALGASIPKVSSDWRLRLGFAGFAGAAAAAAFAFVGPQCLSGPFGDIDPLVKLLWLDRVGESMTLWDRGPGAFIAYAGFGAFGCAGAALAVRNAHGPQRLAWITVLTLALAGGALMLLVSRTGAVAHGFAAAGASYLAMTLLNRARALPIMPVRVFGTVFALVAATPILLLPALQLDLRPGVTRRVCEGAYASLNDLPPSLLFAPLDIGPRIVVGTRHSVIATGHHRNHEAMHEAIATFTGTPEAAYTRIAARNAPYLVLCSEAPEIRNYVTVAPEGFAAQLVKGQQFGWLRPVEIAPGTGLLVFAVQRRSGAPDGLRGRVAFDATPSLDAPS